MKRIVVLALVFNAALLGILVQLLAGPGAPRMRAHAAENRAVPKFGKCLPHGTARASAHGGTVGPRSGAGQGRRAP
ncbi:MAG: hypothetical protein VYB15_06510, partial [Planctomycetota bacterium]|nr:hypothetical protein [Planctomycetota bacterium]